LIFFQCNLDFAACSPENAINHLKLHLNLTEKAVGALLKLHSSPKDWLTSDEQHFKVRNLTGVAPQIVSYLASLPRVEVPDPKGAENAFVPPVEIPALKEAEKRQDSSGDEVFFSTCFVVYFV